MCVVVQHIHDDSQPAFMCFPAPTAKLLDFGPCCTDQLHSCFPMFLILRIITPIELRFDAAFNYGNVGIKHLEMNILQLYIDPLWCHAEKKRPQKNLNELFYSWMNLLIIYP